MIAVVPTDTVSTATHKYGMQDDRDTELLRSVLRSTVRMENVNKIIESNRQHRTIVVAAKAEIQYADFVDEAIRRVLQAADIQNTHVRDVVDVNKGIVAAAESMWALVDSGASVTLLPPNLVSVSDKQSIRVSGFDGKSSSTSGSGKTHIVYTYEGQKRQLVHNGAHAAKGVQRPILSLVRLIGEGWSFSIDKDRQVAITPDGHELPMRVKNNVLELNVIMTPSSAKKAAQPPRQRKQEVRIVEQVSAIREMKLQSGKGYASSTDGDGPQWKNDAWYSSIGQAMTHASYVVDGESMKEINVCDEGLLGACVGVDQPMITFPDINGDHSTRGFERERGMAEVGISSDEDMSTAYVQTCDDTSVMCATTSGAEPIVPQYLSDEVQQSYVTNPQNEAKHSAIMTELMDVWDRAWYCSVDGAVDALFGECVVLHFWYRYQTMVLKFGPKFSSDNAGDGPKPPNTDVDIHLRTHVNSLNVAVHRDRMKHFGKRYSSDVTGDGPPRDAPPCAPSLTAFKYKPAFNGNESETDSDDSNRMNVNDNGGTTQATRIKTQRFKSRLRVMKKSRLLSYKEAHELIGPHGSHVKLAHIKGNVDGIKIDIKSPKSFECLGCKAGSCQTRAIRHKGPKELALAVATNQVKVAQPEHQYASTFDVTQDHRVSAVSSDGLRWYRTLLIPSFTARGYSVRHNQLADLHPFAIIWFNNKYVGNQGKLYGDMKWMLVAVDHYSFHIWISLSKRKTDNGTNARKFIAAYQIHKSQAPVLVITDGDGSMKHIEDACDELGVAYQRTPADDSGSLNLAEMAGHIIVTKTVAAMITGNVSTKYFGLCAQGVAHLHARSPSGAERNWHTPAAMISEQIPNVARLAALGTICFVRCRPDEKYTVFRKGGTAFDRAVAAKLIGYPDPKQDNLMTVQVLHTGALRQAHGAVFLRGNYCVDERELYAHGIPQALGTLIPESGIMPIDSNDFTVIREHVPVTTSNSEYESEGDTGHDSEEDSEYGFGGLDADAGIHSPTARTRSIRIDQYGLGDKTHAMSDSDENNELPPTSEEDNCPPQEDYDYDDHSPQEDYDYDDQSSQEDHSSDDPFDSIECEDPIYAASVITEYVHEVCNSIETCDEQDTQ
ncbi:MAG: hypothetical protein COB29_13185 [Sulfitobacter sp.]|nr:MAG: hypothetical protein COB29_13185 [Sulfitobacter sp.]